MIYGTMKRVLGLSAALLLLNGCNLMSERQLPNWLSLFYYPQSSPLCANGVLVTGTLPIGNALTGFSGASFVRWDNVRLAESGSAVTEEGQTQPGRSSYTKTIAFRLTQGAVAPSQSQALTAMPVNRAGTWDAYYNLGYFVTNLATDPTITVRCNAETPAVSLTVPTLIDGRTTNRVLLIVEDASVPARLRVVDTSVQ